MAEHVFSEKTTNLLKELKIKLPFEDKNGAKIIDVKMSLIGSSKETTECIEFFFETGTPIKIPSEFL